jgi:hypothetical protein
MEMKTEQLKHLEFIQSVISRLANCSFLIKGWSITLVIGILAFSITNSYKILAIIAVIPIMVFWGLDCYFLWQENLFIALYESARLAYIKNEPFDTLNMSTITERKNASNWVDTFLSTTLLLFHGTILLCTVLICLILYGA